MVLEPRRRVDTQAELGHKCYDLAGKAVSACCLRCETHTTANAEKHRSHHTHCPYAPLTLPETPCHTPPHLRRRRRSARVLLRGVYRVAHFTRQGQHAYCHDYYRVARHDPARVSPQPIPSAGGGAAHVYSSGVSASPSASCAARSRRVMRFVWSSSTMPKAASSDLAALSGTPPARCSRV